MTRLEPWEDRLEPHEVQIGAWQNTSWTLVDGRLVPSSRVGALIIIVLDSLERGLESSSLINKIIILSLFILCSNILTSKNNN